MLTTSERDTLLFMREEEKLARDVYLTLHSLWRLPVFSNIAAAEQRHTDSVKGLLRTYGIPDPVADERIGVFRNPELATLYRQLVEQGRHSLQDALEVGVHIEEHDIDDLQRAIQETSRPDIAATYHNLMRGSHNHLRAFTGQLRSRGYVLPSIPNEEVATITPATPYSHTGRHGRGGNGWQHYRSRQNMPLQTESLCNSQQSAEVAPMRRCSGAGGYSGGRRHRGGW